MEGLTKDQKDSFATAYAIMALYDGGVSKRKSFVVNRTELSPYFS
jgi:hypothetical protein